MEVVYGIVSGVFIIILVWQMTEIIAIKSQSAAMNVKIEVISTSTSELRQSVKDLSNRLDIFLERELSMLSRLSENK